MIPIGKILAMPTKMAMERSRSPNGSRRNSYTINPTTVGESESKEGGDDKEQVTIDLNNRGNNNNNNNGPVVTRKRDNFTIFKALMIKMVTLQSRQTRANCCQVEYNFIYTYIY